MKSLQEALKEDPDSPHTETQIANLEAEKGELDKAAKRINRVLESNPNYIPALLLAGNIVGTHRSLEEAMVNFQKIIELDNIMKKEQSLLQQLADKRKDLITAACLQAINK